MQIRVTCSCGQVMLAPPSLAGRTGRCPGCGGEVAIPGSEGAPPVEASPAVRAPQTKKCPSCAEEILVEARKCKHCGEFLDPMLRRSGRVASASPGIALVQKRAEEVATLSLIFGILSLVVCAPIFGPLAVVKGKEAQRMAARGRFPVPGNAQAGIVCGWIGVGLAVLSLLAVAFQLGLVFCLAPR